MSPLSARVTRTVLTAIVIAIAATAVVQSQTTSAALQVSVVVTNPCTVSTSGATVLLTCARSTAAPTGLSTSGSGEVVRYQLRRTGDVVRVDF